MDSKEIRNELKTLQRKLETNDKQEKELQGRRADFLSKIDTIGGELSAAKDELRNQLVGCTKGDFNEAAVDKLQTRINIVQQRKDSLEGAVDVFDNELNELAAQREALKKEIMACRSRYYRALFDEKMPAFLEEFKEIYACYRGFTGNYPVQSFVQYLLTSYPSFDSGEKMNAIKIGLLDS